MEIIDRACDVLPTRHARDMRVLDMLLRHLEAEARERLGSLPVRLTERDLRELRERLLPAQPGEASEGARASWAAMGWLIDALAIAGLLVVPPMRLGLQRPRDLAFSITGRVFRAQGLLESRLTPALFELLTNRESVASEVIALALVWEGPVLVADAFQRLAALRVGDYDPQRGRLRLPARRREVDTPAGTAQWFLRPLAQLFLNRYLLRAVRAGRLDLRDPMAPVFPDLARLGPDRLRRRVDSYLQELVGTDDITGRRLVSAARSRAYSWFPPVLVGALAGRTRYALTPEAMLGELSTGLEVTGDRAWPASGGRAETPMLAPVRVSGLPASDRGDRGPAAAGEETAYEALYFEAREAFLDLQRALARTEDQLPRREIVRMARAVIRRFDGGLASCTGPTPPTLRNLRWVLRWLLWQLEHPSGTDVLPRKSARRTVAIRTEPLVRLLEAYAEDDVLEWSEDEWIDFAVEAMAGASTPRAKRLMRHRIKAFWAYLRAAGPRAAETPGATEVATVDWMNRDLNVMSDSVEYRIPLPWEVDEVRSAFIARHAREKAEVLEIFTILGYGAGLRRTEAATRTLGDVVVGLETTVAIGRSKTRSGRRWIPLHRLLPREELDRFRAFYRRRIVEAGGDASAPLLATARHPAGFDPRELARDVADTLRKVTKTRLTYHGLRHGFASLFLLRWFVAFHGRAPAVTLGRLLETRLFNERALARFRKLFVPPAWGRRPKTTRPLLCLSILMGHSGPEVTVAVYVQTLDWFQRLYIDREVVEQREPRVTVRQAAAALGVTVQAIYSGLRTADPPVAAPRGVRPLELPASSVVRQQAQALDRLPRPAPLEAPSAGPARDPDDKVLP